MVLYRIGFYKRLHDLRKYEAYCRHDFINDVIVIICLIFILITDVYSMKHIISEPWYAAKYIMYIMISVIIGWAVVYYTMYHHRKGLSKSISDCYALLTELSKLYGIYCYEAQIKKMVEQFDGLLSEDDIKQVLTKKAANGITVASYDKDTDTIAFVKDIDMLAANYIKQIRHTIKQMEKAVKKTDTKRKKGRNVRWKW